MDSRAAVERLRNCCDVLARNPEVFEYWRRLGLNYMFLGLESLDEEGLKLHRKRVSPGENFKAMMRRRRSLRMLCFAGRSNSSGANPVPTRCWHR